MVRVLFVCLGNICRSPMAEAVFRARVKEKGWEDRFEIASCGTGKWHIGERPHPGTLEILDKHGIPHEGMRAQYLSGDEILSYDYIIAMDRSNVENLEKMDVPRERVQMLTDFVPGSEGIDVPDPYFDGRFDFVYDLVSTGTENLLRAIAEEKGWA